MNKQLPRPVIPPQLSDLVQLQVNAHQTVRPPALIHDDTGEAVRQSFHSPQAGLRVCLRLQRLPLFLPAEPDQGDDQRGQQGQGHQPRADQEPRWNGSRRLLSGGLQESAGPLGLGGPGGVLPQVALELFGGDLGQIQRVGGFHPILSAVKKDHRLPGRMGIAFPALTA